MILIGVLPHDYTFLLKKKIWSWATSFSIYHHLTEISKIFKKNELKSRSSVAPWSCPTSNFFSFFETSKTYLFAPQMIFWYLNYSRSNAQFRLIFKTCHHLFHFFLTVFVYLILPPLEFFQVYPSGKKFFESVQKSSLILIFLCHSNLDDANAGKNK